MKPELVTNLNLLPGLAGLFLNVIQAIADHIRTGVAVSRTAIEFCITTCFSWLFVSKRRSRKPETHAGMAPVAKSSETCSKGTVALLSLNECIARISDVIATASAKVKEPAVRNDSPDLQCSTEMLKGRRSWRRSWKSICRGKEFPIGVATAVENNRESSCGTATLTSHCPGIATEIIQIDLASVNEIEPVVQIHAT